MAAKQHVCYSSAYVVVRHRNLGINAGIGQKIIFLLLFITTLFANKAVAKQGLPVVSFVASISTFSPTGCHKRMLIGSVASLSSSS